ncbi:MAG: beta-galactosidase trimerization domain-containing protein [Lentisphaeria bacterium]|nr:beta-galactosidase trimerization domain-containing protein [Lentisphaeria bacterium]
MRFRQVHLDFHTSPDIEGIGEKFDKKHWQKTLQEARVNSITCFSSCHHGWSYHPTEVGKMHPHLKFNLLREQIDACHEIGIKVPVYLTGGVNGVAYDEHPEWQVVFPDGLSIPKTPLTASFPLLCFNSPYLDYLCEQLRETVRMFPDADGIFIDIIAQRDCCCPYCMRDMKKLGIDAANAEERRKFSRQVLLNYYKRTYEAVKSIDPDMPIFHNSGNMAPGDYEIFPYFSHYELESLPTGGWGYDHYPMSAAYCRNTDFEFCGMTGKFQTTWGEFGGFKHPNALRYECAAMLAQGSKCSVGDQLHPSGKLDESTYRIIGEAYKDVEQKEPWCDKVKSRANVAILSRASLFTERKEFAGDVGAARLLLELHIPFDIVDTKMDFGKYRLLILGDDIKVDDFLADKLSDYLKNNGKLVLSSESGLRSNRDEFFTDLGFEDCGKAELFPNYIQAGEKFAPNYVTTPFVMYGVSRKIKVPESLSLGDVYEPYFNRSFAHFCSHQHTPNRVEKSPYSAGLISKNILYFAHPIFTIYRGYGAVIVKEFFAKAFREFAGDDLLIKTTLPSQARVTWMEQCSENRSIIHVLYANTILRGGLAEFSGGNITSRGAIEVIEELNEAPASKFEVRESRQVKSITLEPSGENLPFEVVNGVISFNLPPFVCHQMVVLHY